MLALLYEFPLAAAAAAALPLPRLLGLVLPVLWLTLLLVERPLL